MKRHHLATAVFCAIVLTGLAALTHGTLWGAPAYQPTGFGLDPTPAELHALGQATGFQPAIFNQPAAVERSTLPGGWWTLLLLMPQLATAVGGACLLGSMGLTCLLAPTVADRVGGWIRRTTHRICLLPLAAGLLLLPSCASFTKQDAALAAMDAASVALAYAETRLAAEAAKPDADQAKLAAYATAVRLAQRQLERAETRLLNTPAPVVVTTSAK